MIQKYNDLIGISRLNSSGTRAPGTGHIPTGTDDYDDDDDKGGLSGGAIANIVLGSKAVLIILVIAVDIVIQDY